MSVFCYKCSSPVPPDGIGLNMKLINRGIRQFLCMDCLADQFHLTVQELEEMADHFRDAGCQLFTPKQQAPAEKEKKDEKSADRRSVKNCRNDRARRK